MPISKCIIKYTKNDFILWIKIMSGCISLSLNTGLAAESIGVKDYD